MGSVAILLHRLQMHASERAHHFQVAQFFGADIHQQVLALRVVAVQALDGILHRGGEFSVGAAELFEQHVAEPRVRRADVLPCT